MNRRNRLFAIIQVALMMLLASTMVAGAQQKSQANDSASVTEQAGKGATQQAGEGGATPLAPVGNGFTYQGRLIQSGNAADGQYDMTFKLFDALVGGNQVGTVITLTNQTVSQGLFTVNL